MQIDELLGEHGQLAALACILPVKDKILALDVSQLPKLFAKPLELRKMVLMNRQYADPTHALALLRARREQSSLNQSADDQRDELAPSHVLPSIPQPSTRDRK